MYIIYIGFDRPTPTALYPVVVRDADDVTLRKAREVPHRRLQHRARVADVQKIDRLRLELHKRALFYLFKQNKKRQEKEKTTRPNTKNKKNGNAQKTKENSDARPKKKKKKTDTRTKKK